MFCAKLVECLYRADVADFLEKHHLLDAYVPQFLANLLQIQLVEQLPVKRSVLHSEQLVLALELCLRPAVLLYFQFS